MKTKMKILALVLVLSVALTGAGYAAWGNMITANTTLNTGTWEVVLENDVEGHSLVAGDEVDFFKNNAVTPSTKAPLIDNNLPNTTSAINAVYDTTGNTISGGVDVNSTNYVYTIKPTINETKDVATFAFYNLHPGTKANTNYEIRNMGSIPAKIKDVRVKFYNGDTLINVADMNGENDFEKLFGAMKVSGYLFKHYWSNGATIDPNEAGITPAQFSNVALKDLEGALENILVDDNFILQPQTDNLGTLDSDELEVHNFKFDIPIDSLNGDDGEASSLKVSVEYDFIQYNVMVDEASN